MKYFIVFFITFSSLADDISHLSLAKPVKKLLQEVGDLSTLNHSMSCFDECPLRNEGKEVDPKNIKYHVKDYIFGKSCEMIKQKMFALSPQELWRGTSKFDLIYRQDRQELFDKTQKESPIEGDIIFLNLQLKFDLLLGFGKKIPVAFRLIDFDQNKDVLSFSYLQNNQTKGMQKVSFISSYQKLDMCRVRHETKYWSGKKLRDKLYGPQHEKLMDDFYSKFSEKLLEE